MDDSAAPGGHSRNPRGASRIAKNALIGVALLLSVWLLRVVAVKVGLLHAHGADRPSVPTNVVPPEDRGTENDGRLVIKGLSLGMGGEEASAAILAQGNGHLKVYPPPQGGVWYNVLLKYAPDQGSYEAGAIAIDKETRTVTEFYFRARFSDFLFNTGDLSPKDFAQSIINAYGIPSLEPTLADGQDAWRYESPKGWTLLVGADKGIHVFLSPKRKFD